MLLGAHRGETVVTCSSWSLAVHKEACGQLRRAFPWPRVTSLLMGASGRLYRSPRPPGSRRSNWP